MTLCNKWKIRDKETFTNGSFHGYFEEAYITQGQYPPPVSQEDKGIVINHWRVVRILPPIIFIAFMYKYLDEPETFGMKQSAGAQEALMDLNEKVGATTEVCDLIEPVW